MRRLVVGAVLLSVFVACGSNKPAGDPVGALPRQVVVVQTGVTGHGPRVALHRLSGARIASLAGWEVAGDDELRAPDHRLYRLTRAGLRRVTKVTAPSDPRCRGDVCVSPYEPEMEPTITYGPKRIAGAPHPRFAEGWLGHWVDAYLSPDGHTVLATWSGECESPSAYLVDIATGRLTAPQSAGGEARESFALGWAPSGEAVVFFTTGICGTAVAQPGVYAVDGDGSRPRLVARVTSTSASAALVTPL